MGQCVRSLGFVFVISFTASFLMSWSGIQAKEEETALKAGTSEVHPDFDKDPHNEYHELLDLMREQMAESSAVPVDSQADPQRVAVALHDYIAGSQAGEEQAAMLEEHLQVFQRMFDLHQRAHTYAQVLMEEMGLIEFAEKAASNEIHYNDDTLGRAEYKPIDHHVGIKMTDKATELAFLFVERGNVSPKSKHLKQYIDRINMASGTSRTDGKVGRDLFLIWCKDGRIDGIEFIPKPHIKSPEDLGVWAKKYWNAIYKKPTGYNLKFGFWSGVLQTATAAGVSWLGMATGATEGFSFAPMILNFIFGTTIGIYASTYVNWIKMPGPERVKVLKSSFVSATFAALMIAMTGAKIGDLDSSILASFTFIIAVASNIWANNLAKVAYMEWALVKEQKREFKGNWEWQVDHPVVQIPTPIKQASGEPYRLRIHIPIHFHWKLPFKARDVAFQWISYLPVNTLRLMDLTGVPLGTVGLWGSIPLVKYVTLLWAKKKNPDIAQELKMEEKWEASWGLIFRVLKHPQIYTDKLNRFLSKALQVQIEESAKRGLRYERAFASFGEKVALSFYGLLPTFNRWSFAYKKCEAQVISAGSALSVY